MSSRKILIITYYWPPSGGSGVQRWLKFAKYLPEFGWKPYVFTPENPSLIQRDESLLDDVHPETEVLRFPIWEPYDIFFKLSGSRKNASAIISNKKKSFFQRFAGWVRGNFFIPDPKIFWVRSSVKFLNDFLKTNQIDMIVTTGPPHSVHLIGLKLKRKNPSLRWLADFRDPWSEWSFIRSFNPAPMVLQRHARLERLVLTQADIVTTVTPYYKQRFDELAEREVNLITNGFDEDDFAGLIKKPNPKFVLLHVGIVYSMVDPTVLIKALESAFPHGDPARSEFELKFVGEVNAAFRSALKNSSIGALVSFYDPVPHKELIEYYSSSSMLLINIQGYENAEGLLPGKGFEYLACRLPILGIGPLKSDVAKMLDQTGAGKMFNQNDEKAIGSYVRGSFDKWRNGAVDFDGGASIEVYSRRYLTKKLTLLLDV